MGERYRKTLERKIKELGEHNLRVYVNATGIQPEYKRHLEQTFRDAGVRFVSNREEANFIFDGNCEPAHENGKVVAFFREGGLSFVGAL